MIRDTGRYDNAGITHVTADDSGDWYLPVSEHVMKVWQSALQRYTSADLTLLLLSTSELTS